MGFLSGWGEPRPKYGYDVEAGDGLLYPGLDATDNALRWGFVNKVYGIVSIQLVLTGIVALLVVNIPSVHHFFAHSLAASLLLMLASFLTLIPLFIYKDQHPLNLALLGLWTVCMSTTVGMACAMYKTEIVVEAVLLTASVVVALTVYSFWATKRGVDFSPMYPLLGALLWVLIIWGFVQVFWPPGHVGNTVFSLLGALLFAAYLVLDTQLLIQRVSLDDYIWASVMIYLDILNLFLYILRLLGDRND